MEADTSAAIKLMCMALQQNYTLLNINKVSWSRGGEGKVAVSATVEEGSCHSKAAGGGSRRRLIRKYKLTSTVVPTTPADRHVKIKQRYILLCRVLEDFFFSFLY